LAEASNPTVVASNHRADAANDAIDVALSEELPSVSFSAQLDDNFGQTFPTVPARGYMATVNLTLPLYQNGGAASRLRQAKEDASAAKIQIQTSQRDARKEAASAYSQWRAAVDKEAEQRQQVALAEIAYQNVRKEADLGAKSTFELLDQLQQAYNARLDEVNAKYNVAIEAYQLLVAMGEFTAASLHLPTAIYNPAVHYHKVRNKDGTVLPWVKDLLNKP
jgi:outer membrane protein